MILSIIVYTSMMIFLVTSSYYVSKTPKFINNRYETAFFRGSIIISCLIFAIVFGARYDTGVDHLAYLEGYQYLLKGYEREDMERGFYIIVRLFAGFNLHFFFYFAFLAFLQIFFFYYAFRNEQQLYPALSFILMTSFFLFWMNVIRQNIVFCIFLSTITYIENKSFGKYLLIILLCTFFLHKSAIFLLAVYPFLSRKSSMTPGILLQVIILLICIYLNRNSWLQDRLDLISQLVSFTSYGDKYANRLSVFDAGFNFGPRVIIGVVINIFTIIISPYLKNFYNSNRFNIFYTMYFWGTCVWYLFYGNYLLQRPIEYFYYMSLVVYAFAIYYLCKVSLKKYKYLLMFLLYAILQIGVYCGTIYSTTQPNEVTAFHFFWQN